jgi:hypothetical protein
VFGGKNSKLKVRVNFFCDSMDASTRPGDAADITPRALRSD